jgi:hypothetical protein
MLGDEILARSLLLCDGVMRPPGCIDMCGDTDDRRERVRAGKFSCCRIEPMPSCASNEGRSNGEDVNSVAVGDMSPKASAESTSGEGCSGVMANSAVRGEAIDIVGVVVSSSFSGLVGIHKEVDLIFSLSGSTTLSTGITWPEVFT